MMYVFPFDVEFIARLGDNVIKIDRFVCFSDKMWLYWTLNIIVMPNCVNFAQNNSNPNAIKLHRVISSWVQGFNEKAF